MEEELLNQELRKCGKFQPLYLIDNLNMTWSYTLSRCHFPYSEVIIKIIIKNWPNG